MLLIMPSRSDVLARPYGLRVKTPPLGAVPPPGLWMVAEGVLVIIAIILLPDAIGIISMAGATYTLFFISMKF
jgi:hypothetical protein